MRQIFSRFGCRCLNCLATDRARNRAKTFPSVAKAEADPFAELKGWESMEQIQDAYGYGEITADRRDKLTDLWEAREDAKNSRKGSDKYTDLVTEMLETAIRRVGNEYADMLFEYDRQRREAEKQCEQLAMEGMIKK